MAALGCGGGRHCYRYLVVSVVNLTTILAGAVAVLVLLLGLAVRDDIHQRGLLEAQSVIAEQDKKENERLTKSLTEQRDILEANNAKAVDDRKRFDNELNELRARQASTKRAIKAPITSSVCADPAANDRLAQAVSRYRSAVDSFRDAVGDYRIAVLGIAKDAQQCTDTLVSCQGYVQSICRAGLCE